jgi:hypothetical protein
VLAAESVGATCTCSPQPVLFPPAYPSVHPAMQEALGMNNSPYICLVDFGSYRVFRMCSRFRFSKRDRKFCVGPSSMTWPIRVCRELNLK